MFNCAENASCLYVSGIRIKRTYLEKSKTQVQRFQGFKHTQKKLITKREKEMSRTERGKGKENKFCSAPRSSACAFERRGSLGHSGLASQLLPQWQAGARRGSSRTPVISFGTGREMCIWVMVKRQLPHPTLSKICMMLVLMSEKMLAI